ncbi:MAG: CDP-alcohol phosphatidyltransferase family protein [Kofleriaceae bacterium]
MTDPAAAPPEEDETLRRIRYLAPNAVTAVSLGFGMLSLVAARDGAWALSAWMIIYAVLSDRLDGLVARRLHATSAFGMQLDSFADFLNFGLAPAFLFYAYLTARPDLPYGSGGTAHVLLMLACAFWVCCAVFRLARYNVQAEDAPPTKIFFGIPSTMAGGLLAIWFLVGIKYDRPGDTFGGLKIFGDSAVVPREVWLYAPIALVVFGWTMASSLPMPKGPNSSNKLALGFVAVNLVAGYILGFAQQMPDVLAFMPTVWLLVFLVWGQVSQTGRGMHPPQLFPPPTRPARRP